MSGGRGKGYSENEDLVIVSLMQSYMDDLGFFDEQNVSISGRQRKYAVFYQKAYELFSNSVDPDHTRTLTSFCNRFSTLAKELRNIVLKGYDNISNRLHNSVYGVLLEIARRGPIFSVLNSTIYLICKTEVSRRGRKLKRILIGSFSQAQNSTMDISAQTYSCDGVLNISISSVDSSFQRNGLYNSSNPENELKRKQDNLVNNRRNDSMDSPRQGSYMISMPYPGNVLNPTSDHRVNKSSQLLYLPPPISGTTVYSPINVVSSLANKPTPVAAQSIDENHMDLQERMVDGLLTDNTSTAGKQTILDPLCPVAAKMEEDKKKLEITQSSVRWSEEHSRSHADDNETSECSGYEDSNSSKDIQDLPSRSRQDKRQRMNESTDDICLNSVVSDAALRNRSLVFQNCHVTIRAIYNYGMKDVTRTDEQVVSGVSVDSTDCENQNLFNCSDCDDVLDDEASFNCIIKKLEAIQDMIRQQRLQSNNNSSGSAGV